MAIQLPAGIRLDLYRSEKKTQHKNEGQWLIFRRRNPITLLTLDTVVLYVSCYCQSPVIVIPRYLDWICVYEKAWPQK